MKSNKLLKTINTQLLNNPSLSDCEEAIEAIKEHVKIRRVVQTVFTNYGEETRWGQVEQYFKIRQLLEIQGITFPRTRTDDQSEAVKYFNLEWKSDKTARLYWSSSHGWTIEHKDFNKELKGVWEGFNFEQTLIDNDLCFDYD